MGLALLHRQVYVIPHQVFSYARGVLMLKRVDRVQIVVRDRVEVTNTASAIFGAQLVRDDKLKVLGAKRTVCQIGASIIEFLEPEGAGPVADFAARRGGGLYAAGFSVAV